MVPVALIVPVDTDNIEFRLVGLLPVIEIVPVFNVNVPTIRPLVPAPVIALIVRLLSTGVLVSKVTVKPLGITTSFVATGTTPPVQVVVLLQLPVAFAVIVTPLTLPTPHTNSITQIKKLFKRLKGAFAGVGMLF